MDYQPSTLYISYFPTMLTSTWPILLASFNERIVFGNLLPQECISLPVRGLEVGNSVDKPDFFHDQDSHDYDGYS